MLLKMAESGQWKVDKTINVGEVLTFITMSCIMAVFLFEIRERVALNENVNVQQTAAISRNTEEIKQLIELSRAQRLEIKSDLQRLESSIHQAMAEQGAKIDRVYSESIKRR